MHASYILLCKIHVFFNNEPDDDGLQCGQEWIQDAEKDPRTSRKCSIEPTVVNGHIEADSLAIFSTTKKRMKSYKNLNELQIIATLVRMWAIIFFSWPWILQFLHFIPSLWFLELYLLPATLNPLLLKIEAQTQRPITMVLELWWG